MFEVLDSYGQVVKYCQTWKEANNFRETMNRRDWEIKPVK